MNKNSILKRFISKVDVKSDNECWPWLAYKDQEGYGRFTLNNKWVGAHRIAYFIRYGKLPLQNAKGEELFVCHSCDNTSCVNPAHLFLGTCRDNHRDSISKGRRTNMKGSCNPGTRLTESQVIIIRKLITNKISYKKITKLFGIAKATISQIATRKTWRHI